MEITEDILISLYLKRDLHENGMSLKEYADAIINEEHPVLDHDDFVYQFGATEESLNKVVAWAQANGLSVVEADRGQSVVKVSGPASKYNELFKINLHNVTDGDRTYMVPGGEVIIPKEISDMIEMVPGFDQSFVARRHAVMYDTISEPDAVQSLAVVNPIQMGTAYKAPAGTGYGECIGIFELSINQTNYKEGWHQPDVTASFSRIGLTAPTVTTVLVNNPYFHTNSSVETMLDIYCAGAASPKSKIVTYFAPNTGTQNIIDNINAAANDTVNNPSVLSISWGIGDGTQYDTALQSCIAKGITVFVSSGDSGANNLDITASCCSQYMISSGGTNVTLDGSNNITAEVAWSGSGGGISASVALPSWQSGLTTTTITASSTGTPTTLPRRAIPDISAPADPATGYAFYYNGTDSAQGSLASGVGGTSASAPLLAGIWARLNRLLGKRIPFNMSTWYSNSSLFNDITSGNNRNGLTTGYTTTSGWDPVTGLGSPKADQIYKYFHTGSTFPKSNYGFRPTSGQAYPRRTTGVR
jgi:kumamolisin